MGMAPYGEPRYVDKVLKLFQQSPADGSFRLNMDYFSFHHSTRAPITSGSSICSARRARRKAISSP